MNEVLQESHLGIVEQSLVMLGDCKMIRLRRLFDEIHQFNDTFHREEDRHFYNASYQLLPYPFGEDSTKFNWHHSFRKFLIKNGFEFSEVVFSGRSNLRMKMSVKIFYFKCEREYETSKIGNKSEISQGNSLVRCTVPRKSLLVSVTYSPLYNGGLLSLPVFDCNVSVLVLIL
jgi:hypothetical protein